MKRQTYLLGAAILFAGLTTTVTAAETKRVNKGRAGYSYQVVHRAPTLGSQRAATERPKTVGLIFDRKAGRAKMIRRGGRAAVGARFTRR
jgi:hypothetical protein